MTLILLLLCLLTALGFFEMARHRYYRRRVPIRIHVNGSRGKSSVTRLIAAGLRAGGIRTLAKTTGSAACIINPDGTEQPFPRRGWPNIREQLRVFRQAAASNAEALVLECMAIRPDLQQVCEHRIVKSTLGVICNVRPDHVEVMGPRLDDVARSLGNTVPRRSHLVCGDDHYAPYFQRRAAANRSRFTVARIADVQATDLAGFSYVEFPENVSLALAACQAAGVPRERALAGMRRAQPDVGALRIWGLREQGKDIRFINAFAANDPVSYLRIWDRLKLDRRSTATLLLINIRADRQRRSKDLVPLLGRELAADHYVLIGQPTRSFCEALKRQGIAGDRIHNWRSLGATEIWGRLCGMCGGRTTIVGIGNIGGVGGELTRLVQQKGADG